jgi:hypothetical protein
MTIDLEGYGTGSMNEILRAAEKVYGSGYGLHKDEKR